jgi:hypothetical protein
MTLMEDQTDGDTSIRNEAEIERKAQTHDDRDKTLKSKGHDEITNLQKAIQRLTQRTVKFIRCLKNHLDTGEPKPKIISPRSMPPHEVDVRHRCFSLRELV